MIARDWQVCGDRTGRVWRYHVAVDRLEHGERWCAVAEDDGSLACLHKCENDSYWVDEFERLQAAVAIASRPEVQAADTICQLLDVCSADPILVAIWEWADASLVDFLDEPDEDPRSVADAIEANVGAALDVLHSIGMVHMDVAPNNVLRIGGTWKLADLDSCVPLGQPAVRRPRAERYVHPDVIDATPAARYEFDDYGLRQILARVRG